MKKTSRGFTLIELLVVIAIIGILSSVVLAALGSARQRGTDAAIQSELASMRSQAELYRSQNLNTYGISAYDDCSAASTDSMFASTTAVGTLANLVSSVTAKAGSANVGCGSDDNKWAVQASTSQGTWCVDSAGSSKLGDMDITALTCL